MKCNILLFFLIFPLFLSLSLFQYSEEKSTEGAVNKYINFTGEYGQARGEITLEDVSYEYLILKLYANITGFTKSYAFKLNLTEPSFIQLNCTIPSSSDNKSYIECTFDYEKYGNQENLYLPNEFPQIEDCKILYWEFVSKNISSKYYQNCPFYFYPYKTYWPLCDFNNQYFFEASGILSHQSSLITIPDNFSFSIPVLIDGIEKYIPCSIYKPEYHEYRFKCFI